MDYLSRIKSSVVDTVSNLSSVLTGNPLSGQYEMGPYLGCYGPALHWKMYQATKRSTREEACVFLLEKKSLERYPKADREYIITMLKQGVAQLTRLRHPSILTVSHPLEESRESLAFATEACFCSLSNILSSERPRSPSSPTATDLPDAVKDYTLHQVEIKYGLAQLSEGLAFLHNDAKRIHGNICPESVVINKKGAWKLAGFDLSVNVTGNVTRAGFDATLPSVGQPNYDYVAPESALEGECSPASDMYSLGVLIYSVHTNGSTVYSSRGNFQTLKTCLEQMKNFPKGKLQTLPQGARDHVKLLLSFKPQLRPDAHQFGKLPFLEDIGVKTLRDLDSLYQLDKVAKSHIYKGLPPIIEKLPKRINLYRVLPCLVAEYVNAEMVPFILPSVLIIAEIATKEEFTTTILPDLTKVFTYREPVHIMYLILQKMDLLISKCPPEAVRDQLLPMVYRAVECNAQQIQELCLNTIPSFANLVEYGSMKNHLLPKIKKLTISTSLTSTRVGCLVCIGKILEHLDKWVVLDDIIAWLPEVKSRDSAVLMAILGIYKVTLTHQKLGITKEILACKVIPFLVPLSIESGLSLSQFNQIIALVKDMIASVENEHRIKLEQTDTSREDGVPSTTAIMSPNADELMSELNFSSPPPLQSNGASKNLSMDEKQRLARQEESMQFFDGQTTLTPKSEARPQRLGATRSGGGHGATKDLTSTLINSNLLSLQNKTANIRPAVQSSQYQPNYNISPSVMSPNQQSNQGWSTPGGGSNWSSNATLGNGQANQKPSGGGGWGNTSFGDGWDDWCTAAPKNSSGVDLSEFDTLVKRDADNAKKDILRRNRKE